MVKTSDLVGFCNDLLNAESISDYCPNGLQVQGRDKIKTIVTAVTASLFVIDKAVALNADALLVHHGFFWKSEPQVITNMKYKRISMLIRNGVNLIGYHLPLDMHHEYGNNKQLAGVLGFNNPQCSQFGKDKGLFWSSVLEKELNVLDIAKKIEARLKRKPLVIGDSGKIIKKVAWCTGAAQSYIELAVEQGCDAFISGEVSESTFHFARENEIAYFAAGHHATERFGVQALGECLSKKYNLSHVFVDEANPV